MVVSKQLQAVSCSSSCQEVGPCLSMTSKSQFLFWEVFASGVLYTVAVIFLEWNFEELTFHWIEDNLKKGKEKALDISKKVD